MKKQIIVIAFLFGLVALACTGAVAQDTDKVRYENKDAGYAFDFLNNWTKTEKPMEGFDVAFVHQETDAGVNTSVLAGSNQLPDGKKFEDTARDFMDGFGKSIAGYESEKAVDTTLDGAKAIRIQAKGILAGKDVNLVAVIGTKDGKFVFVMMMAPVENRERDFKIFDDILVKSFKWAKK